MSCASMLGEDVLLRVPAIAIANAVMQMPRAVADMNVDDRLP